METDTRNAAERLAACPDPGKDGFVRVGWRGLTDGSFSPAATWPGPGFSPVYVSVRPDWKFVYTETASA